MTEVLNDKEKELKDKEKELEKDIKKVDIPDTEWVVVAILLIILGVTAAFMYLFYIGITDKVFLKLLGRLETARGFITLVITIGTLGLALLLMIYALTFRVVRQGDFTAFKDRFSRGQQVFTALVGILGTIVGFYFGSTVTETKKPLSVNQVIIDNANPKPGDTITLKTVVNGGKAPYKYHITFDPDKINPIKDKITLNGKISESIIIKEKIAAGEYSIIFKVTDAEGTSKTIGKDKTPKIKVAGKKPAPSKRPKRR